MAFPSQAPAQEPRDPEPPANPATDSDNLMQRISGAEPLQYSETGQMERVTSALRQWPALALLRALAAKRTL